MSESSQQSSSLKDEGYKNYFDFIPQKSNVDALADDLDKVHMDFAAVLKQFNNEIILSTGIRDDIRDINAS
ncbi:hypothetical protein V2H77_01520 [Photorhabdus sp. P32]|uniref:hypothetical protein n=1 Tax=Photorhabdus sp. P32 TaxID=3117549 RepID=UPI00311B171F